MAIFDKQFSFQEMLRRTVFKGRPNFFNAKDMNKELLILHTAIEEFNRIFAVWSDIKFTIPSFSETNNSSTNEWTRALNLNWSGGSIFYRGVKFNLNASGITGYTQTYDNPLTTTDPKEVKPPTYIILKGKLKKVTYADNPTLCGIQSDEIPNTVPTVDVEQFSDLEIDIVSDFTLPQNLSAGTESKTICVLATIHPKYTESGDFDGFGLLYNTFDNPEFTMSNGQGNEDSIMKNNETLFEYLLERVTLKLNKVYNETQLVRRFNLADLEDTGKARHNIGLSNLVNYKQLVQEENLRDIINKPLARLNLGLGTSSTANIGVNADDVAPGNIMPIGGIIIWSGSPSEVPDGWEIATELEGKFIVGYSQSDNDFKPVTATGGSKTSKLDESNLPEHTHNIIDPGHSHGVNNPFGQDGQEIGNGGSGARSLYNKNVVIEDNTTGITIDSAGSADPDGFSILPPYYVVAYIRYIGFNFSTVTPPENPPTLAYPNFSEPTTDTDNCYIDYEPKTIGSSGGLSVGSGITLTNPE